MAVISGPETLINITVKDDGVALVEFNRPKKRNALSQSMIDELARLLSDLDRDTHVRVAVLSGTKDGPFSGEAFLVTLGTLLNSYQRGRTSMNLFKSRQLRLMKEAGSRTLHTP